MVPEAERVPEPTPEQRAQRGRPVQDVCIGRDEAFVHQVLRIHQGREDVVVRPIVVVPKRKLRIALTNLVDLVSTNETEKLKNQEMMLNHCLKWW